MKMSTLLLGAPDRRVKDNETTTWENNKIGGSPDWFKDNTQPPCCSGCDGVMTLVTQIYCPLSDSPFHRCLHLFVCPNRGCSNSDKGWRVVRTQLCVSQHQQGDKDESVQAAGQDDWGQGQDDWGQGQDDWGQGQDDWGEDEAQISDAPTLPTADVTDSFSGLTVTGAAPCEPVVMAPAASCHLPQPLSGAPTAGHHAPEAAADSKHCGGGCKDSGECEDSQGGKENREACKGCEDNQGRKCSQDAKDKGGKESQDAKDKGGKESQDAKDKGSKESRGCKDSQGCKDSHGCTESHLSSFTADDNDEEVKNQEVKSGLCVEDDAGDAKIGSEVKDGSEFKDTVEVEAVTLEEEGVERMLTLLATKSDDGTQVKQPTLEGAVLAAHYMEVFAESEIDGEGGGGEGWDHVSSLLDDYKQREGPELTALLDLHRKGKTGAHAETYDKTEVRHGDKACYKFIKRLQRFPQQCIRYQWKGVPLLMSTLTQELSVEQCLHCGAARVFELQLVPPLIPLLTLPGCSDPVVEFGTVLIFTCSQSCWAEMGDGSDGWREEFVVLQHDPYHHLLK